MRQFFHDARQNPLPQGWCLDQSANLISITLRNKKTSQCSSGRSPSSSEQLTDMSTQDVTGNRGHDKFPYQNTAALIPWFIIDAASAEYHGHNCRQPSRRRLARTCWHLRCVVCLPTIIQGSLIAVAPRCPTTGRQQLQLFV